MSEQTDTKDELSEDTQVFDPPTPHHGRAKVCKVETETDHQGGLTATFYVRRPPPGFRITDAIPDAADIPQDIRQALLTWAYGREA